MKEDYTHPDEFSSDLQYQKKLLLGVSRSFALTIPQLPEALRSVVTNAYLLCRIADTIEDEKSLSIQQKRIFFHEFVEVVSGKASSRKFAARLFPLLSGSTLPAEKELIHNTDRLIRVLHDATKGQRAAIERCVTIMCKGMQRFQEEKDICGLRELRDLDDYCYHVAGVVGELLTDLFCEYSEEMARSKERLMSLAVSFGQGLQMTNILKDFWDDRKGGACWLPQDVFQQAGFDLNHVPSDDYVDSFGEGLAKLISIACFHLKNALAYTLIIPRHQTGIRKFCLWAIGMAIFTLKNLKEKRDYRSGKDVKISRRQLRSIIFVTNATLRSNYLLKKLFSLTTKNLSTAKVLL